MYAETDLDSAVRAGAISQQAADALRRHVAQQRATPMADEEHFRLITGFNDIFVSIALVLVLVALGWVGSEVLPEESIWKPLAAGVLVAGASWPLAEYFTRRRRMALPSILLLVAFAGGLFYGMTATVALALPEDEKRLGAIVMAGVAALVAGAAWLHWRRFMVPITIAAGAVAALGVGVFLLLAAVPSLADHLAILTLAAGIALFVFAMKWDMSDQARITRRADVAFWLHLAAAPLIAHSLFQLLGIFDGDIGSAKAMVVILLYVAFALVAVAVDRRALLVSSLAYVLYAIYALFEQVGVVELSAAFTAMVIGSALLLLSAFWQSARRALLPLFPAPVRSALPHG